jgi:hypothetical protein
MARSAAGWGESARSALLIPASPRTPPRVPSGRDPPPPGEGEVSAFSRRFTSLHLGLIHAAHKKGGGALIDATVRDPHRANRCCHLSALGAWARLRARTPTGAPPRLLHRRTNATAQPQAALPGTWLKDGCYPSLPVPVQRASRRPVVMPAGRLPRAARERSANPPAGTALAPYSGVPREHVP